MKLRGLIVLLFAVASLWVGCAEPDGVEPIQDKETPRGQTVVRGVALMSDGSPAAHATVYLISDGMSQRRLRVLTDDAGAFAVDGAFVGEVTLVINNGAGQGHLEEITTFAGGSLDVGELVLAPLEQHARLVDIAQVGFEERVTREAGDYQYPVYNEDASKVYAARKLEGQDLWTLVAVDTGTGQETILKRDVLLYTRPNEINTPPLMLLKERYLLYYDQDGPSLHDVVQNKTLFEAKAQGLRTYAWWPALFNEDRVLFFEPASQESLRGSLFGGGRFRWRLRGYDWSSGEIVQIAALPASSWLSQPMLFHTGQDRSVVGIHTILEAERDGEIEDWSSSRADIFVVDLAQLKASRVATQPVHKIVAQGPGRVLLASPAVSDFPPAEEQVQYPSTLHSLELATMRLDNILTQRPGPTGFGNMMLGAVDPQGAKAVYWDMDLYWHESKLMQIDLMTRRSSPVDLGYEVGLPLLCQPFGCDVRYDQAGELQVFANVERGDDLRGVFAQFVGSARETHEVDLQEGAKEMQLWWNMLEVPQLMTKVFAWRVLETGFFQLFVDEPGQTAPRQRTFLPGHHEHFRLSADGQQLYYFTKDPLSGHVQLFRLRLNALPALP